MTTTEPTTAAVPPLPDQAEVDATIKLVTDNAQRVFLWNYERGRDQLVTLYNKAMGSQWNSVTDLDWATDVDPERLVNTCPSSSASSASPARPPSSRAPPSRPGPRRSSPSSASSRSRPSSASSCTASRGR